MAGSNEGYDPSRFIHRVRPDFICCFCSCVVKDARLCKPEEHLFCNNCISRWLADNQNCPTCRQHLTLDTLERPGRILRNRLSEQMISCDYKRRGCPEAVELRDLERHVGSCGYRPETCGFCDHEMNHRDIPRHQFSCENSDILNILNNKYAEISTLTNTLDDKVNTIDDKVNTIDDKVNTIDDKVNTIEGRQNRIKKKAKKTGKKMKDQFDDIEQTQSEMNGKINEMDDKINKMDDKINGMNENNEYNMEVIQNSHSSGDEEDEG